MGNWNQPKGKFGRDPLPWYPMPHMEEYLDELTVRLNTEAYIRAVKKGLAHFGIFCRDEDLRHPAEVERKHILRFQAYLQERNYEPSYQQRLTRYVRSWYNWLNDCEYLTATPFVNIKIRRSKKQPDPLTEDELASIFEAHRRHAFKWTPFDFHREEVILTMLYGWGLRIHELHSIDVQDVDMRRSFVTVKNKGGGTKDLPYPDPMKQVVQRWLAHRARRARPGEHALIVGNDGGRLSIDRIRRIVVDLGSEAGVSVNPHRLRDTCGTDLVNADVPIETVAKILGHKDLSMTRAYSEIRNKKVAKEHSRAMDERLKGLLRRTGAA